MKKCPYTRDELVDLSMDIPNLPASIQIEDLCLWLGEALNKTVTDFQKIKDIAGEY